VLIYALSPGTVAQSHGPTAAARLLQLVAGAWPHVPGLIPHEYREELRAGNILHHSLLNLHSLAIVGRLQIEWVPYISQHLVLDIHTRTFRIF
jgi:hypothetical protein